MIAQACSRTHNDPIRNLAFTADSQWLFSGDDGGLLVLSSVPDGQRVAAWQCHESSISALAIASQAGLIITADIHGRVRAWSIKLTHPNRLELVAERIFKGEVSGLAFRSASDLVLAISVVTGEVILWKPTNRDAPEVIYSLPAQANSVAWTQDGIHLGVGCDDCLVYQFDLAKSSKTVFRGHNHHVDQLSYSHCGQYLASGSHDRTVRVWDTTTGTCLAVLPHLLDTVKPDWAQDGRLVTCSYDKRIRVWRPSTFELLAEMYDHQYDIDDVAWSPDNHWIASCSWDHTVRLYDGANYQQVAVIEGSRNQIYALTLDATRRRFFAGTAAGKLFEVPVDGKHSIEPKLLPGLHNGAITSADLSPNGKILATTGADSNLILRAVDDWQVHTLISASHGLDLDIVRFSPEGDRLAVGARDNTLTIYAVDGMSLQKSFHILHERRVKALDWSSASGLLATAADGNVRFFDPNTGNMSAQWRAHDRMINAISWDQDGSMIATACWDRLARIFCSSGKLLHELKGHLYNVNCVAFGPFGVVVTGGWDGTVGFWEVSTGNLLKITSLPQSSPVHVLHWIHGDGTLLVSTWAGRVMLLQWPDGVILDSWDLTENTSASKFGCEVC